jgi:hypothetical protein
MCKIRIYMYTNSTIYVKNSYLYVYKFSYICIKFLFVWIQTVSYIYGCHHKYKYINRSGDYIIYEPILKMRQSWRFLLVGWDAKSNQKHGGLCPFINSSLPWMDPNQVSLSSFTILRYFDIIIVKYKVCHYVTSSSYIVGTIFIDTSQLNFSFL